MLGPGIAIVVSMIEPRIALPVEIAPGHVLRPPTHRERATVTAKLKEWLGPEAENRFGQKHEGVPGLKKSVKLPSDQWNLLVVTSQDATSFRLIDDASLLTRVHLKLPLFVSDTLHAHSWLRGPKFWAESTITVDMPTPFEEADVLEIREVHRQLLEVTASHPELLNAFDLFRTAERMDTGVRPRVLELFIAVESLLTSDSAKDRSAKDEVTAKMKLLSRRALHKLNLDHFDKFESEHACWAALFNLRGRVAHGRPIDFSKDFKSLRGWSQVDAFLFDALRMVWRQTLREPDLVADLMKC